MMRMTRLFTILLLAALASPLMAQRSPADFTITPEERLEAIEGSIRGLKDAYVFPDVALKMEQSVRERLEKGEYDSITSGKELAAKLTDDFRAVSRDKHLSVFTDANGVPDNLGEEQHATEEQIERMRVRAARVNFGFEKVERMEGNVGYIDIRGFAPPEVAGETGAAAMSLVGHSDALIVDLRQNHGGEPAMIAFLMSYLFDRPTHLNDIYTQKTKSTEHWWTSPHVPGRKFGGEKPLFVLTSSQTFSGGEEFAYNVQTLERGTVIGETTGGGAHPVRPYKASERFAIAVPYARAINPITKTNWEGVGVTPDITVPADEALDRAYTMALESILPRTDDARQKSEIEKLLETRERNDE